MSISIPTISLSSPTLPHKSPRLCLSLSSYTRIGARNQTLQFRSPLSTNRLLQPLTTYNAFGFSARNQGFLLGRKLGFWASAENGEGERNAIVDNEAEEARGESTMPSRFRYLTKEAPDPPVRWPWFIALAFLIYAWRTVLFELSNWKNTAIATLHFVGYLLKLTLALVFQLIGDPITSLLRCIETALYTVRAFYSSIIAYAPIPELTLIIMLASSVLAIAEATVPNSINGQPYLLTVSGLIGYAAVRGLISEPFFWTLLLGVYGFSRLVKKRDDVSAAMPVAAVLAAIGEPWVRVLVIGLYLGLAISHHWKKVKRGEEEEFEGKVVTSRRLPLPLLGAALAIGIRFAAKWAGYRHLTWMIA